MTVQFRLRTKDGDTYVGPIQGNGGPLGGGAEHAGPHMAMRAALKDFHKARRLAARRQPLHIYEPQPGCVSIRIKEDTVRNVRLADVATFEIVDAPVMWIAWQRHSASPDGTIDASLHSGRNTTKGHAVRYPWNGDSWSWPELSAVCGASVPAGDDTDRAQVFHVDKAVPKAQRCKRCIKRLKGSQPC